MLILTPSPKHTGIMMGMLLLMTMINIIDHDDHKHDLMTMIIDHDNYDDEEDADTDSFCQTQNMFGL